MSLYCAEVGVYENINHENFQEYDNYDYRKTSEMTEEERTLSNQKAEGAKRWEEEKRGMNFEDKETMTALLNYTEFGAKNTPSLKTLFSDYPYERQEEIAGYLEDGEYKSQVIGYGTDVFTSEIIQSPKAFGTKTDGEFVWASTMAYYVRRYNLRLPTEIETKILVRIDFKDSFGKMYRKKFGKTFDIEEEHKILGLYYGEEWGTIKQNKSAFERRKSLWNAMNDIANCISSENVVQTEDDTETEVEKEIIFNRPDGWGTRLFRMIQKEIYHNPMSEPSEEELDELEAEKKRIYKRNGIHYKTEGDE